MAVVHVALAKNFVGSFPAQGQDPLIEARRAAVESRMLEADHASHARLLIRDGRTLYQIDQIGDGWRVTAGGGPEVAVGEFPVEAQAHGWLLQHLGFEGA